ncbi:hypothetical protein B0O80DRAFT_441065 [Mortierella sp. GBAus27b]|nr:hypothetical protein B0O80DRAFT_441065 [Mortierella sp. GBAus27b]
MSSTLAGGGGGHLALSRHLVISRSGGDSRWLPSLLLQVESRCPTILSYPMSPPPMPGHLHTYLPSASMDTTDINRSLSSSSLTSSA